MCVAIYKKANAKCPSWETFEKCWDANPDGAGYAWIRDDGRIEWRKGFMKFGDFWESLETLEDRDERNMLFHFRIGTSGGNIPANTHPFPISATPDDLRQLSGVADAVLMHNGVLPIKGREKSLSDTMELALRIAESGATPRGALKLLNGLFNDRVLVMTGDGVSATGQWELVDDVYYSNLAWRNAGRKIGLGMYDDDAYGGWYQLDDVEIDAWMPDDSDIAKASRLLYGNKSRRSKNAVEEAMREFIEMNEYFDMREFLYEQGVDGELIAETFGDEYGSRYA